MRSADRSWFPPGRDALAHLDGAQVGTGFEQMRGKAVAQSVGMDALVLKAGALGSLLTGCLLYTSDAADE